MTKLSLHTILLEQQSTQNNTAYYEKLQKEYDQLATKNKSQLENPSIYWQNSPDFKRMQELEKLLEPYKKQKSDSRNQSFVKSMRDTVNDQSASYPEAEKSGNVDMWLNMWARDFVLEFSKNELFNHVPPGGYGYCSKGYIHSYEMDSDREFQGKKSLYQELLNLKNSKIYICDPQLEMMKYKWDHKFIYNGDQIGWWQLLNLDWGIADKQKLKSALYTATKNITENNGQYCTKNESGTHCTDAVYQDPLNWFKDPHNILTFFEVVTVFVPIIGPVLSAGFGLGNAALYLKEGDKKDAALSAFFAILPGLGSIGAKIVVKMGAKELEVLSEKLIQNGLKSADDVTKEFIEKNASKFTKEEIETLNGISKNKEALKNEISKIPVNDSKKLSEFISGIKNKTAANITDVGINVVGVASGLGAYPLFKTLNPGVKEKIEKMGYSFEDIKTSFLSSGSKEDNLLMLSALNNGWTPDQPVPEKYKTQKYKDSESKISTITFDYDPKILELAKSELKNNQ